MCRATKPRGQTSIESPSHPPKRTITQSSRQCLAHKIYFSHPPLLRLPQRTVFLCVESNRKNCRGASCCGLVQNHQTNTNDDAGMSPDGLSCKIKYRQQRCIVPMVVRVNGVDHQWVEPPDRLVGGTSSGSTRGGGHTSKNAKSQLNKEGWPPSLPMPQAEG